MPATASNVTPENFNIGTKHIALWVFVSWLLIYIFSIGRALFKLKELSNIIKVLENYLNSAKVNYSPYKSSGSYLEKSANYNQCLADVLFYYPIMNKYTAYYCGTLEYGADDRSNLTAALEIYNHLLMQRNKFVWDLRKSFNPLAPFKSLFSLPGLIFSWFGFPESLSFSRLFNAFIWMVLYLLNMYQQEIKSVLELLFEKLTQT